MIYPMIQNYTLLYTTVDNIIFKAKKNPTYFTLKVVAIFTFNSELHMVTVYLSVGVFDKEWERERKIVSIIIRKTV